MQNPDTANSRNNDHIPWNKGKLIGAKPPLIPSTSGRSGPDFRSKGEHATSQCLILPSIAKLRGCDLVNLRVEDVAPHGRAVDRVTVRRKRPDGLSRSKYQQPQSGSKQKEYCCKEHCFVPEDEDWTLWRVSKVQREHECQCTR